MLPFSFAAWMEASAAPNRWASEAVARAVADPVRTERRETFFMECVNLREWSLDQGQRQRKTEMDSNQEDHPVFAFLILENKKPKAGGSSLGRFPKETKLWRSGASYLIGT